MLSDVRGRMHRNVSLYRNLLQSMTSLKSIRYRGNLDLTQEIARDPRKYLLALCSGHHSGKFHCPLMVPFCTMLFFIFWAKTSFLLFCVIKFK